MDTPNQTQNNEQSQEVTTNKLQENQTEQENDQKSGTNEPDTIKKDKQKPTTVQLTVKEMNKIKKQLALLETLKSENSELKSYTSALQKKGQDNKKAEMTKQGMQETIKHLQKMVDESSKNQQRSRKEESKYKELCKHEKEMTESLRSEIEELRGISTEYFLLKQEVSRLTNEIKVLKEERLQYPIMIKKYEDLENEHERLKIELERREKQLSSEKQLKSKLQNKVDSLLQTSKALQNEKQRVFCEKEELEGELQALKQFIDDQNTEKQVQEKKTMNQIKQLKVTLHQEHEKLKLTEQQLVEAKKNATKTIDLNSVRMASLSKEDLFNLLEESEMKIVSLKMAINDAGDRIEKLTNQLKEKDIAVMTLSRQIMKSYPNLDESEGMQYVEKDIIEIGKQRKDDWPEIVEKVMIENLRLKNSVTALGEEYNLMRRMDTK